MEIKDLKAKTGNVDVVVEVAEKAEAREFEKFGKSGKVCNATVKDSTGTVTLTLWNEDVDKVNVGDKIHIENGWVGEWQGELQLSTGKFGKLEVVSGDTPATEAAPTESPDEAEETPESSVEEEVVE
ncbi:DNA-binding protein [Candidatus Woesearchaeota archaeon]|mgnify:CR=1 FL=1|jgi:replication factor A1|nr:DNA-binding protein [Candidatus Woesearchaeota archaeon]MBT4368601.1 DNA-binding protein [Candidatus Woesearchaeota archaeon]MBT4713090.1 DNA-binding protein [Candidatus Woesearchaeota archaeon]MBT6639012.1 DNA-binding protein [Candidatus Woesearchaeota archaeon]MBT7134211.1 DNA-binding protein [Candidatus Woesearchaeota archaeon]